MVNIRVNVFPILFLICVILTLSVSYVLAVMNKHTVIIWPYISDTGSRRPESCYFSQFLNMAIIPLFVVFHARYVLINIKIEEHCAREIFFRLNFVSFLLGNIMALSLSLVANFQSTAVPIIHFFGALFFFMLSFIYMLFQIIIDFFFSCTDFEFWLTISRLVLCALYFIAYFLSAFYTLNSHKNELDQRSLDEDYLTVHNIATVSQWIAVILLLIFVLTFLYDFKTLVLNISFCKISRRDSLCSIQSCNMNMC